MGQPCTDRMCISEMSGRKDSAEGTRTVAIIAAAGAGIRMGEGRAKQFLDIHGTPLLALTLQPFQLCGSVEAIVLVVPAQELDYSRKEIVDQFGLDKVKEVVAGGEKRQDSVRRGLRAAGEDYDLVLIHDGVRPFIDVELVERMVQAGLTHGAAIPGLPARDTVKETNRQSHVVKTHDRGRMWLIQTPQAFRHEVIWRAHQRAFQEDWEEVTDDSLLVERIGIRVKVVMGSERNIKVTTPYDLELARFLVKEAEIYGKA